MSSACDTTSLLGGRVVMQQPEDGYRVAIDAVLTAAAVPASAGQSVLDVGAGTAAIGLCLAARVEGVRIVALERAPEHVQLARRNIALNDFGDRIELVEADLFDPPDTIRRDFDHVVTNPPFHAPGRHRLPNDVSRSAAGHATQSLAAWLAACTKRVRSGGWLTCIHKSEALAEILSGLTPACGDLRVTPCWPRADSALASRVIVQGRKASGGPLRLCRGLILHAAGNSYTPEAEAILRHGQRLGDWS